MSIRNLNHDVPSEAQSGRPERLVSLDAYRGAIMLMMASAGFGLAKVARQFPDSNVWQFIGHQTEHAQWAGFTLWDIIQPAFMFMVGVALPFSIANRRARGQSLSVWATRSFFCWHLRARVPSGWPLWGFCWPTGWPSPCIRYRRPISTGRAWGSRPIGRT